MDKKDSVNKYMTFYMSIGMCWGGSSGRRNKRFFGIIRK